VQCIIAEDNVQFCQGSEAGSAAVSTAFNMCSGFSNALPNTHPTLTATLIIQTASPSIVQVAPTPTTLTTSRYIASTPTSTAIPTTEVIIAPTASRATSSTSSASPTASADQQQATEAAGAATKLNTGQIAGIGVASVGVVALAAGIIAVAVCLRRRRQRQYERDSDLIPFGFDTGKGNGFKGPTEKKPDYFAPGPTRNGVAAKVGLPKNTQIPKVPTRINTDPNMFSRTSLPKEEIGVALSPEEERHASRLLPEKPILRLHVPPEPAARKAAPPSFPMPQVGNTIYDRSEPSRDSAMTQFEEDSATPYTPYAYEGSDGNPLYELPAQHGIPSKGAYIWQTNTSEGMGIGPDDLIRPLEIRKPVKSFSQPLRPITTSSSVYSARGSLANSDAGIENGPWRPHPQQQRQQQQYNPYMPYRNNDGRESLDSTTDIESQGEPAEQFPHKSYVSDGRIPDLSPVAESPVAVSPVSYPKIPKLSPTLPYPPQAKFHQNHQHQRTPPPRQQSLSPRQQAERDAARARTQNQQSRRRSRDLDLLPQESHTSPIQPMRSNSSMSSHSNSSSLAEKRRGKEHANALKLKETVNKATKNKRENWRVVEEKPASSGLSPSWKPQSAGRTNVTNFEGSGGNPPMSPSPWELTPKKLGNDLYLTVR
jgi:hypothetical protein